MINEAKIEIPCEIYSRVSGYLRPTFNWNAGKREEFSQRKILKVPNFEAYSASTRNFNTRGN